MDLFIALLIIVLLTIALVTHMYKLQQSRRDVGILADEVTRQNRELDSIDVRLAELLQAAQYSSARQKAEHEAHLAEVASLREQLAAALDEVDADSNGNI